MKNILDATPNGLKDKVHFHVQAILEAPDEDKAPKAMSILEASFGDASAVLSLLEKYRKRLCTTNSIERLNEEIRRRERVIPIFPSTQDNEDLLKVCLAEGVLHVNMDLIDENPEIRKYNEWFPVFFLNS